MLAALEYGVKGGKWYSLRHAYPVKATYSSLAQSFPSFISNVAQYPIRAIGRIQAPTYEDLYRGKWCHPKLTEVASTG